MNDIVKAPFPILFFALCEVGKPWPIILSYLFPSPSYTWGFDQYHMINPKEGRNNQTPKCLLKCVSLLTFGLTCNRLKKRQFWCLWALSAEEKLMTWVCYPIQFSAGRGFLGCKANSSCLHCPTTDLHHELFYAKTQALPLALFYVFQCTGLKEKIK